MLKSLEICGNILTTKDYHYFVLHCSKCDSAFGQWSGFIKHLESYHNANAFKTEWKSDDEQHVEFAVKREIETELNKQDNLISDGLVELDNDAAPAVEDDISENETTEEKPQSTFENDSSSSNEEPPAKNFNRGKLKSFIYSLQDESMRNISIQFLKVVEKHGVLWDSKHPDNRNAEKRTNALVDIKEHFEKIGYSINDAVLRRTIPKILRDYKEAKQEAIVCGRASKECALILNKCKFLDDEESWKSTVVMANIESDVESNKSFVDESVEDKTEICHRSESSSSDSESNAQHAFYLNGREGKRILFAADSNPLVIELINLVRDNPVLWYTKQPHTYTERKRIMESWIPIFEERHNVSFTYKDLSLNVKVLRNYCYKLESRKRLSTSAQHIKELCSFLPKTRDSVRIKCEHCDRLFLMQQNYQAHLYHEHQIGENPFKCQVCSKDFPSFTALDTHLKTVHMKQQTVFCEVCNRGFFRANDLAAHFKIHTGEKDFVCEVCGRGFRRRVNLKNHEIRIHLRQRNFACELCPKTYYIKAQLRDHMNAHLNIRNHKCPTCAKAFHSSHALMRHKQIHSAVKRYACKLCDARFHQFVGLNSHMKNKHRYVQDKDEDQSTSLLNNVDVTTTEPPNGIKGELLQSINSFKM